MTGNRALEVDDLHLRWRLDRKNEKYGAQAPLKEFVAGLGREDTKHAQWGAIIKGWAPRERVTVPRAFREHVLPASRGAPWPLELEVYRAMRSSPQNTS